MPSPEARLRIRRRFTPLSHVLPVLRRSFVISLLVALAVAGLRFFSQPFSVGALEFTPHVVGEATSAEGVLGIEAVDLDKDGDYDIVTAGLDDLKVYENLGD